MKITIFLTLFLIRFDMCQSIFLLSNMLIYKVAKACIIGPNHRGDMENNHYIFTAASFRDNFA